MKNKFLIILTILLVFASLSLASCGKSDEKIVTDIRFVVYENEENGQTTDMISFYMTSDIEPFGTWQYNVSGLKNLSVFHESDESNEYGNFLDKGEASYKTLILKPTSVGVDTLSFALENGETRDYKIDITKDKNGIFKIKAELLK